jgi:hypothetical protein
MAFPLGALYPTTKLPGTLNILPGATLPRKRFTEKVGDSLRTFTNWGKGVIENTKKPPWYFFRRRPNPNKTIGALVAPSTGVAQLPLHGGGSKKVNVKNRKTLKHHKKVKSVKTHKKKKVSSKKK